MSSSSISLAIVLASCASAHHSRKPFRFPRASNSRFHVAISLRFVGQSFTGFLPFHIGAGSFLLPKPPLPKPASCESRLRCPGTVLNCPKGLGFIVTDLTWSETYVSLLLPIRCLLFVFLVVRPSLGLDGSISNTALVLLFVYLLLLVL